MAHEFMKLCDRYGHHFVGVGMNSVNHARHYLTGLLGRQRRKNIETIHNDVSESDFQGIEQFISSSPWSHQALMEQVARDASGLLGGPKETGLFFDHSCHVSRRFRRFMINQISDFAWRSIAEKSRPLESALPENKK